MSYKRIVILIMDSVGCGVQPDYRSYHSQRANTLEHIYKSTAGFSLQTLETLGLSKILGLYEPSAPYIAGKMRESTAGNDTFAGVWEMMGVINKERFRSLKYGFDHLTMQRLEKLIGTPLLANEYLSGFKVLKKYYDQHVETGAPILYLADDGVVLLAAHELKISPRELNRQAAILADALRAQRVSRIITRPFVGSKDRIVRTENRRDHIAAKSTKNNVLSSLIAHGVSVTVTDHLFTIFGSPRSVAVLDKCKNNEMLIGRTKEWLRSNDSRGCFMGVLQDFDMHGHKKDIHGYATALMKFDAHVKGLCAGLRKDDLLILTADHGCDPSIMQLRGHTREYVPLILVSKSNQKKQWLGTRESFADLGQTLLSNFDCPLISQGKPIYEVL